MPRGGCREGAGRPKGSENFLTKELRGKIDAESIIEFMQNVISGKSDAPMAVRVQAAAVLLKKALPDMGQIKAEIEHQHFEPVIISDQVREAVKNMSGA